MQSISNPGQDFPTPSDNVVGVSFCRLFHKCGLILNTDSTLNGKAMKIFSVPKATLTNGLELLDVSKKNAYNNHPFISIIC